MCYISESLYKLCECLECKASILNKNRSYSASHSRGKRGLGGIATLMHTTSKISVDNSWEVGLKII